MAHYCGLVEGFYWKKEHSVEGQYGEFDAGKRRKLLEFMGAKGLDVYVYDPKILRGAHYERAYSRFLIGDADNWKETFRVALDNGICFVWGLAPGRYEHWKQRRSGLRSTVDFVLNLGAAGLALLFDDVPRADTESEMRFQAELVDILHATYPGKIHGLCSGVYCGSREELECKLKTLDDNMNPEIDLVFTGREVWPESIELTDLPRYESGRKSILWDNWMASDTNDAAQLKFKPPAGRTSDLFANISEYWLNLNFPVERIIHMVSALGEIRRHGGGFREDEEIGLIRRMAKDWAGFLGVEEEPIMKFLMMKAGRDHGCLREKEVRQILSKWSSLEPLLNSVTE